MTLPTFFIVGAQRSGTTSLYHYLAQHPEIFMPAVKEPRFFALEGRRPQFKGLYPTDSPMTPDRASYEALYEGAAPAQARGDASTWYLYEPVAARRIRETLPEARIIAILRRPAERAYSNYLICRSLGIEPLKSFEAALAAEPERRKLGWGNPWYYFQKGLYCEQLERYFALFPADRISVHLYDDLVDGPANLLRRIFEFLGVDPSVECDTSERHNESRDGAPRHQTPVRQLTSILGARRSSAGKEERKIASNIPSNTRRVLIDRYRADIRNLEGLIGRDLNHWLSG
jgi:hypothetical protein